MMKPADVLPVTVPEAAMLLAPLRRFSHRLLAVSGGPDSMALMGLAAAWAKASGLRVSVATMDHGLRPDAAQEARMVAEQARRLGLPHHILRWQGEKPGTGLQAAARQARYDALVRQAGAIGADAIVTAHHADDQAETVLMRLTNGSGLTGLAGMVQEREAAPGVTLCRPLLTVPKARLVVTCQVESWPFVTDPSNGDDRFARARLRQAMPVFAAEGLTPDRLRRLGARAARADAALASMVDWQWAPLAAAVRTGKPIAAGLLLDHPEEMALRLLDRAIGAVITAHGLPDVPERLERLERLLADLITAGASGTPLARTLRGVLVRLSPSGRLRLLPAPPRGVKGSAAKAPGIC